MIGAHSFLTGVFWTLAACLISALNDALGKKLGQHLEGSTVLFFRFFFSVMGLLPFLFKRRHILKPTHWRTHAVRGGLFALAMLPWYYALAGLEMPLVTTMSFTTPLFVTILAPIWLKETVGWQRMVATVLGFIGIMASTGFSVRVMDPMMGLLLLATFLFAVLDIVNKTMLRAREPILSMMWFSSCWSTLFILPLALWNWQWPSLKDGLLLVGLGLGSNALLGCLLRANTVSDLSALQPFRYMEFLFSCTLSVLVFHEPPQTKVLWAMAFILPSTLYLSLYELRKKHTTPSST